MKDGPKALKPTMIDMPTDIRDALQSPPRPGGRVFRRRTGGMTGRPAASRGD
jgi:hypothetical protein